jgi:xylan 1,4-beta-xylosidase
MVSLGNEGRTGTVWYDDLKISVKEEGLENLIGDGGFEGPLGQDHWFLRHEGVDWDELRTWAQGSTAEIDRSMTVAGTSCLKLHGPATMVSKVFPYRGETLSLSGWLRTKDIQAGKRGWCGAGVQIAGLDANGKALCHTDLKISYGSNPWTFYSTDLVFHGAVKQVQVWLRVFDGAKGEAWFDEMRLMRVPLRGGFRKFDAAKATIIVDAGKPGGVINHRVWAGVDVSYASWLKRADVRETLEYLHQTGFELIRMHEINNGFGIYPRDDKKGNPVYNWSSLDETFDLLVKKYKMVLVPTIESTPDALARPGTPKGRFCNRVPPADFAKWGRYVEALFDHCVQRYGKAEVEKWLWEIWNEPCCVPHYYNGSFEDFLKIAEQVYLAAERVEKRRGVDLKMGLTSGGGDELNMMILNRLKEWGKFNLFDHYSEHFYIGSRSPLRLLEPDITAMQRYYKRFPEIKQYQIGCTEWNCNSMGGEPADSPWNATMVIKAVRTMLDGGMDYATFFNLIDHPELRNIEGFTGFLGMFTKHPVPKPVFNAFVFLHELAGGRRLNLVSSNDPVDGLAVILPDGTIRMVVTSYDEDVGRQPYRTAVTLTVQGCGSVKYTGGRHWIADEDHGNAYRKWKELGRPTIKDTSSRAKLLAASKYGELDPVTVDQKGGQLKCTVQLASPGIQFIELKPVK